MDSNKYEIEPGIPQVFTVCTLACVLLVISLCTFRVADTTLPAYPSFLLLYGAAICILEIIAAVLLFGKYRSGGELGYGILAGAYLYVAAIAVPQIGTISSQSGLLPANSQTDAWLWVFWHGGFPILVILAVLMMPFRIKDPGVLPFLIWVITAVALVTPLFLYMLVSQDQVFLSSIVSRRSFTSFLEWIVGPFIVCSCLVAMVLVWRRARLKSAFFLWLLLALFAAIIECLMAIYSGNPYSTGWYASRLFGFMSSAAVVIALIVEALTLYRRVAVQNLELKRLASEDQLTGLANRRTLEQRMELEFQRAIREKDNVSFIMLDVDHFKKFNDEHGHPNGDRCLQYVASLLRHHVSRGTDLVARYGGEEFVILLPGSDVAGAMELAEKIRQAVAEHPVQLPGKGSAWVTASSGVACLVPVNSEDKARLIKAADEALYRAKASGRNRVEEGMLAERFEAG